MVGRFLPDLLFRTTVGRVGSKLDRNTHARKGGYRQGALISAARGGGDCSSIFFLRSCPSGVQPGEPAIFRHPPLFCGEIESWLDAAPVRGRS